MKAVFEVLLAGLVAHLDALSFLHQMLLSHLGKRFGFSHLLWRVNKADIGFCAARWPETDFIDFINLPDLVEA